MQTPMTAHKCLTPQQRLTWSSWRSMFSRCRAKSGHNARFYSARGVRVCERWANFDTFVTDVGLRPSRKHTLDRYPDTRGNYEPGNVRWATATEQSRNRRSNARVNYRGKLLTFSELAEIAAPGVTRFLIRGRIVRSGWDVERALSTPVDEVRRERRLRTRRIEYRGQLMTHGELSAISNGISADTIRFRLLQGWSVDDAITRPLGPYKRRSK